MMTYLVIAAIILIPAIFKAMVETSRKARAERKRAALFAANGVTFLEGTGLSQKTIAKLRKSGAIS